MLNQSMSVEAAYSANYVENYLDCVENFPDELQRLISRMRELDVCYLARVREASKHTGDVQRFKAQENPGKRTRIFARMQQALIAAQELGDEKMKLLQVILDKIEYKTRMLDQDLKKLDFGKDDRSHLTDPKDTAHHQLSSALLNNSTNTIAATASGSGGCGISPSLVHTSQSHTTITSIIGGAGINSGCAAGHLVGGNVAGGHGSDRPPNKRARRARNEQQILVDAGVGVPDHCLIGNERSHASTSAAVSNTQKKTAIGKKKKRKSRQNTSSNQHSNAASTSGAGGGGAGGGGHLRDDSPGPRDSEEHQIDPDEPTYCLCDQISYGEMIMCDNDLCPIEWFHFSCVTLTTKPKGKWFCPKCRGDRPNVMKPKAQFLRELEKYNKDKEEKT